MGVYRHLLGDPGSIDHFRDLYKVPASVEVRPDGPDDGLAYRNGWKPFWLVPSWKEGSASPFIHWSGTSSGNGGCAHASYSPMDIKS